MNDEALRDRQGRIICELHEELHSARQEMRRLRDDAEKWQTLAGMRLDLIADLKLLLDKHGIEAP